MLSVPEQDRDLLRRYGMLDDFEVIHGGWCSRVYGSRDLVLKVPFVGEEITHGWRAALALSGNVGVEVLDHDPATGVLLMRRLRPGTPLASTDLDFDEMREVFVGFFKAMEDIPAAGCMPIVDYFYTPEKLPQVKELDATSPSRRFLHADLHHSNILDDGGAWVVIDPKGVVGDPHYELVAWLRNPIERLRELPDLTSHLGREIEILCHRLSLDPSRVIRWGLADSDGHPDPSHPWARLPKAYASLRGHRD
jgi:streptomycin 6-kinase